MDKIEQSNYDHILNRIDNALAKQKVSSPLLDSSSPIQAPHDTFAVKCLKCDTILECGQADINAYASCSICDFHFFLRPHILTKYPDNFEKYKINSFVWRGFNFILQKGLCSDDLILLMQSQKWTKEQFGIEFALLKKYDANSKKTIQEQTLIDDQIRYWNTPVRANGNKYLIHNAWIEQNRASIISFFMTIGISYEKLCGAFENIEIKDAKRDESEKEKNYHHFNFSAPIIDLRYTKPEKIIIYQNEYNISTWKDVLLVTCGYLLENNTEAINKLKGQKFSHFTNRMLLKENNKGIIHFKKLRDNFWIETNFNANTIVKLSCEIAELCEIELSEISVYYSPSSNKSVASPPQKTNNNLQAFLNKFRNLNRGMSDNGPAPHKPILLLSIIHAIESGVISKNRIYENELQDIFHHIWSIVVNTKHKENISLPFKHLVSEGFWNIVYLYENNNQSNRIDYAFFDYDLFSLLQKKTSRSKLKEVIYQSYFMESGIVSYVSIENIINGNISKQSKDITDKKYNSNKAFDRIKMTDNKINRLNEFKYSGSLSKNSSIKILDLKNKASNALKELKVKTVADLLNTNIQLLETEPGFGEATIDYLKKLQACLFDKFDMHPPLKWEEEPSLKEEPNLKIKNAIINYRHLVNIPDKSCLQKPVGYFWKNKNEDFYINDLFLSKRTLKMLRSINLFPDDSTYLILCTSIDYFIRRLGFICFSELVRKIDNNFLRKTFEISDATILTRLNPMLHDILLSPYVIPKVFLRNLQKAGFIYWGDLKDISEKKILQNKPYADSFLEIFSFYAAIDLHEGISKAINECSYIGQTCDVFIDSILEGEDKRNKIIFTERIKKTTLEDIAKKIGVTRERVRQIQNVAFDKAFLGIRDSFVYENPISVFILFMDAILRKYKGIVSYDFLQNELNPLFPWGINFSLFIKQIVKFIPFIEENPENQYFYIVNAPCLRCRKSSELISKYKLKNSRAIPLKNLTVNLNASCKKCSKINRIPGNCRDFCYWELLINNHEVTTLILDKEKQCFYDKRYWVLTNESIVGAITYLLGKKGTMHISEIQQELAPYRPNIKLNSIQSSMSKPEFSLVKRGTYVLTQETSKLPVDIIHDINKALDKHFGNEMPLINVEKIFKKIKERLLELNIKTTYAFYEAMKRSGRIHARFLRCPYMTSLENQGKISISDILDNYILEKNSVTRDELTAIFCDRIGFKDYNITGILSNNPDLIQDSNGQIFHFDSLPINNDELWHIKDFIEEQIKHGTISMYHIFDSNKISCYTCGIKDAKVLFFVLKKIFGDYFSFRYPQISKISCEPTAVAEQINIYLKQKQTFCSYDDLEELFVKQKHFSPQAISSFMWLRKHVVFRYFTRCVVHHEVIGWSAKKNNQFLKVAGDHLENSGYYAYVNDIETLYYKKLPILDNNLAWTDVLLGDILNCSEEFLLLGGRRNIYIAKDNIYGINSFGDLCALFLENEFDGATNISVFEKFLREKKLISYELTPAMIDSSIKIKVDGREIRTVKI